MSPEDKDREEIEMLLPWYAAGTLEADETARVDAYLAGHPDIKSQLALVAEEMDETIRVNESLGSPAPGAMDRLMAQVRQESPRAFEARGGGIVESIIAWFGDLSPRASMMGAALAIAVICAQAITLGVVTDGGSRFTSASDGTQTQMKGTLALIGFAQTATLTDVNALLTSLRASIVDGPKAGGIYTVRLSSETLSDADRDTLLDRVRSNPLVRFAAPAG